MKPLWSASSRPSSWNKANNGKTTKPTSPWKLEEQTYHLHQKSIYRKIVARPAFIFSRVAAKGSTFRYFMEANVGRGEALAIRDGCGLCVRLFFDAYSG